MKQAETIGVEATPSLFINGEEVPGGAVSATTLRAALDRALRDANLPVPNHADAPAPASR
jgi:predicted DsbA family dithiol-disulfide isomerase